MTAAEVEAWRASGRAWRRKASRRRLELAGKAGFGDCTVDALVAGNLAVHRGFGTAGYSISHAPSGKAIASTIRRQRDALAGAALLEALLGAVPAEEAAAVAALAATHLPEAERPTRRMWARILEAEAAVQSK
jgi:hypothetical protein